MKIAKNSPLIFGLSCFALLGAVACSEGSDGEDDDSATGGSDAGTGGSDAGTGGDEPGTGGDEPGTGGD